MRMIKSIFKYLCVIIMSLIIGLNIYSYSSKFLLHNELPMPFDKGIAVVMSGSMSPTLEVDDVVIVSKDDGYQENDIVIYQHGHSLIIHRIIEINGDEVITKGDFNNAADSPIDVSNIKGKMIYRIPKIGYLIYLIRKPIVSVSLVALTILLFELSFIDLKNDKEKEKQELLKEIERLKNKQ